MSKVDEILKELCKYSIYRSNVSPNNKEIYITGKITQAKSQLLSALLEDCPKDKSRKEMLECITSPKENIDAMLEKHTKISEIVGFNQANQLWKEHIKKVLS